MAKVTAPLLSFNAGGAIAKSQVYARWKGIPYVRRYVVPANPQTSAQTETRSVFTTMAAVWKNLTADAIAPWSGYASGKPLTNRNAFIGFNVKALRPGTDWTDFIASPGAGGGIAIPSFSASGGSGTISTTVTAPTPPTGWTLSKVTAVARKNDDPHTTTLYSASVDSVTSTPWEPAFSGLAAGSYEVSAFPVYTKPDGSLAYGPSVNHTATVT